MIKAEGDTERERERGETAIWEIGSRGKQSAKRPRVFVGRGEHENRGEEGATFDRNPRILLSRRGYGAAAMSAGICGKRLGLEEIFGSPLPPPPSAKRSRCARYGSPVRHSNSDFGLGSEDKLSILLRMFPAMDRKVLLLPLPPTFPLLWAGWLVGYVLRYCCTNCVLGSTKSKNLQERVSFVIKPAFLACWYLL